MPAELLRGHPLQHPEGKKHGGVPSAKGQHHPVIAIFDTKDECRVADAAVTARVAEIGLAPTWKKLDLMTINEAASYGDYFSMGSPGPYRIEIEITRPGVAAALKTSFEYLYPRR